MAKKKMKKDEETGASGGAKKKIKSKKARANLGARTVADKTATKRSARRPRIVTKRPTRARGGGGFGGGRRP